MTYLEWIAAVFGFLCVALYTVRNMWSWPTGLVQVLLLIVVFWNAKLYADMALHVVYVFLQLYGWHAWWKSQLDSRESGAGTFDQKNDLQLRDSSRTESVSVRRLSKAGLVATVGFVALATCLLGAIFANWTDASFPWVDSLITASSLAAQFLLAKRFIENWIIWIGVDTIAVGLFAAKELYPTALLYVCFWFLAVYGWRRWTSRTSKVPPTLWTGRDFLVRCCKRGVTLCPEL